MADTTRTALFRNIKRNMVDSTLHTALDASRSVAIVPSVPPLAAIATPYWLVHPGTVKHDWGDAKESFLRIKLSLIWKRFMAQVSEDVLFGDGTLEGAMTETENMIDALTRAHPFNDGIHITGVTVPAPLSEDYVTQGGVLSIEPISEEEPEWIREYGIGGEGEPGEWNLRFVTEFEAHIVRD